MRRLATNGLVMSVLLLALGACDSRSASAVYQPGPELQPAEVVRRQVAALRHNATWGDDRGIRRAYRFASPANRESVGPLAHFAELLRNPGYRALLNHRNARYGEVVYHDSRAAIPVSVTSIAGQRVDYVFFLSRTEGNDCSGCWLTDGVYPGPDNRPDTAPRVRL